MRRCRIAHRTFTHEFLLKSINPPSSIPSMPCNTEMIFPLLSFCWGTQGQTQSSNKFKHTIISNRRIYVILIYGLIV